MPRERPRIPPEGLCRVDVAFGRSIRVGTRIDERVLLGRRIKELRAHRGMSQEQFAEAMGANAKYVSSVERGRENPTLDFLIKLAAALDADLCDLFNFAWVELNEKDLRRKIKALADQATLPALREMLTAMKSREL